MRNLVMTLALCALGATAQAAPDAKNFLSGDYVEARTASVFAGACHFNGELTTDGREAEAVWHIREGAWNGVSLSGLNVLAAVVGEDNLRDEACKRQSILYIDDKATPEQEAALTAAFQKSYGKSLGAIVEVHRAPITFTRKGEAFRAEAKGITTLRVDAMPNRECCKQPNLVWYKPMVAIKEPRVGFTQVSGIQAKTPLGPTWTKNGQNSAFYGTFSL